MKLLLLSLCLGLAITPIAAQPGKPKLPQVKKTHAAISNKKNSSRLSDKAEYDKAVALTDLEQKVAALKSFVANFPASQFIKQAREALVTAACSFADENLAVGESVTAIDMYRLAVASAPEPVSATLYADSLAKIPTTLFWRGDRVEAADLARQLEKKAGNDAEALAGLSTFWASTENGDEALRLAEAAVKADPARSKPYAALGLALRINFRLEESAAAYAKASELDPTSVSLKRSHAEIKRAIGRSDEAVALYRDALAADGNDLQSKNGLILSLFDAGKIDDAEKELASSLEANPTNVMLMAGAAYWYAGNRKGDKAIDLAQKAIAAEPRYVWSYIALGRGLILQDRPLEAEEVLLKARQYGNFPTLDYEIASARMKAGFYRDAIEGLRPSFSLVGDGISTKVGARVSRTAPTFGELLADERRASILEPTAADDSEMAARIKQLLIISEQFSSDKPDEAAISKAADAFVNGEDKFKYHRQLYASSLLLNKKIAVDKALEFAEAAVGNADNALAVPNANSLVMASELYESRQIALGRGELVKVPDVPRQLLAAILRGRIEDLIGWGLLQKEKPADAAIHFKRAVAILPEKSAWWRAGMWRLGAALQADGKEQDALDAYIKSYSIDKPDLARYTTVEALYKKLNGSTEGLETKIGAIPLAQPAAPIVIAKSEQQPPAQNSEEPKPQTKIAEPTPTPQSTKSADTVTPLPLASEEKKIDIKPSNPSTEPEQSPSKVEPISTRTPAAETPVIPTPAAPSPTPATLPTPVPSASAESSPSPPVQESLKPGPPQPEPPKPEPQSTPATSEPIRPDPTPTPQIKIEPAVQRVEVEPSPSPTPDEKTVSQLNAKPPDRSPKEELPKSAASASPKPLFEPIIITIPKADASSKLTESEKPVRPTLELTRPGAESRPRVIVTETIRESDPSPCQINVSQERLSLLNNGGSQSVVVGVDRPGTLSELKFVVSDPEDISVFRETEVSDIQGRNLYIVRSTSEKTGNFRVTFYLPCGKQNLSITVR